VGHIQPPSIKLVAKKNGSGFRSRTAANLFIEFPLLFAVFFGGALAASEP
jgi:hypothetical protein